eukprot:CAMPEP_0175397358 /NCGR_PEP_ID=MMETSP0095-20121207/34933_1 /TAXON_ID=311494 /ORGANISM="Alexandrium monilatum, Strain CCMP3105" /LENGTH=299 /DNA_ID=CAMNT_0016696037 /DNA_START=74 /DNA_END=970 /DNA_ORIENTATION=-
MAEAARCAALGGEAVPAELLHPRGQSAPPPAGRVWGDVAPLLHNHHGEAKLHKLIVGVEAHALHNGHREHEQGLDGLGCLDRRTHGAEQEAVSPQLRPPLQRGHSAEVHTRRPRLWRLNPLPHEMPALDCLRHRPGRGIAWRVEAPMGGEMPNVLQGTVASVQPRGDEPGHRQHAFVLDVQISAIATSKLPISVATMWTVLLATLAFASHWLIMRVAPTETHGRDPHVLHLDVLDLVEDGAEVLPQPCDSGVAFNLSLTKGPRQRHLIAEEDDHTLRTALLEAASGRGLEKPRQQVGCR